MTSTGARDALETEPASRPITLPDGRTIAERRRPGRVAYTNPALITLLRGDRPAEAAEPPSPDNLDAARGIWRGALIGVVLWGLAMLAVRATWSG